jgi:hypothetical protein
MELMTMNSPGNHYPMFQVLVMRDINAIAIINVGKQTPRLTAKIPEQLFTGIKDT